MTRSGSDLSVYRRLLSYTPWAAFFLSLFGFVLYSVANVSVVQLVSYLVDSLQSEDNAVSHWLASYAADVINIQQIDNQVFSRE